MTTQSPLTLHETTTRRPRLSLGLAAVVAAVAAVAAMGPGEVHAQSVPYEPQSTTGQFASRAARIVVPARLHREVEVSRSLAAQPVHPWMVKVVLGNIRPLGTNGTIHTWIDPLRKLDGSGGLDDNHSLARAQRLFLSLSGITQRQIDAVRIESHRLTRQYGGQSRARIVTPHGTHTHPPRGATVIYPAGPTHYNPMRRLYDDPHDQRWIADMHRRGDAADALAEYTPTEGAAGP